MNPKAKKIIMITAATIACAVALYFIWVFSFWLFSGEKIYPGISVAGVELGGKTKAEAKDVLNQKVTEFQKGNLEISGDESIIVPITETKPVYDVEESVKNAYLLGRKNPFFLGHKKEMTFVVSADYSPIIKGLKETKTAIVNAKIESSGNDLVYLPGKDGERINYAELASDTNQALGNLNTQVKVQKFKVGPTFSAEEFSAEKADISAKTSEAIILWDGDKKYEVDQKTLISWVGIGSAENALAQRFSGDELMAALSGANSSSVFSFDAVNNYMVELSKKIDSAPKNATLGVENNRVIVTKSDILGRKLNTTKSASDAITFLDLKESNQAQADSKGSDLVVEKTKAEIRADNLVELGLTELVSSGYSTFTGSPANRKHNITVGASKFNGILIKPDEKFSFIKTLGPVDASTGYLPELVIKEDKTIPEYGGGMCQVSSTAFRAALNGGLPILERTPHSYPVSYYKPFGVDATVYIPKPDLVFKNDTGKYIFVQTKIEGTKLTFEFYGTKKSVVMKFSGNEKAEGAVDIVEKVSPTVYDQGVRGNGSFTALVYRHIYDGSGKLLDNDKFVSKYDSPDKYPH